MIALLMVGLIRASEELTPHIFVRGVEPSIFGHDLHTIWGYGKVVVFLGWLVISTIKFFWLPMMGVALLISGDAASISGDTGDQDHKQGQAAACPFGRRPDCL